VSDANVNLWDSPTHALEYLARADSIPHRSEGERTLLECLPSAVKRVLDLGSGDGRLLALVRLAAPESEAVAVDFSDTMHERLQQRFANDPLVKISHHDLDRPLPDTLGTFDAVVSSVAIHRRLSQAL
jgi:SAM-dependent methyltransferase